MASADLVPQTTIDILTGSVPGVSHRDPPSLPGGGKPAVERARSRLRGCGRQVRGDLGGNDEITSGILRGLPSSLKETETAPWPPLPKNTSAQ